MTTLATAPADTTRLTAAQGDEPHRLAALRASGVLVSRPQPALDALARAAAVMCGVPVGAVNFIDGESTRITASIGMGQGTDPILLPRRETPCEHTLTEADPVLEIADMAADGRPGCAAPAAGGLRFYAGAKLVTSDHAVIGTVCVFDHTPGALTDSQRDGLADLATVASTLIEQYGIAQQLVAVTDRLGQEADTDPLTGLYNRRALERVLANLPPRTAVAMLDLDHFKNLNDTRGHDAGDAALRGYAEVFGTGLRNGDVAARWGGEEFLLVLSNTVDPLLVMRRLRDRAAQSALPVTYSAGLTVARLGEDPSELLARVDRMLYAAKGGGRDRTVDDLDG